jgi:hypothetical protein
MKIIIYWTFYISSLYGEKPISGIIQITDSTVSAYLYPLQYFEWQVVYSKVHYEVDRAGNKQLRYGKWILQRGEVILLMEATDSFIYQEVHCHSCSHHERILLQRDLKTDRRTAKKLKEKDKKRTHVVR